MKRVTVLETREAYASALQKLNQAALDARDVNDPKLNRFLAAAFFHKLSKSQAGDAEYRSLIVRAFDNMAQTVVASDIAPIRGRDMLALSSSPDRFRAGRSPARPIRSRGRGGFRPDHRRQSRAPAPRKAAPPAGC